MPVDRLRERLKTHLAELEASGTAKGKESVVVEAIPPSGDRGSRFRLEGEGDREFIRMNSNSYLGLAMRDEMVHAEEAAAQKYGVGPGAVRFISGTYAPHLELERRLARFHGREAAMIFSAAYATVAGVITSLSTAETIIISDELNHNSIINGMRMARPLDKAVYKHNDVAGLEQALNGAVGRAKRVLVITDGIFSMRGDHAPLKEIAEVCRRYDADFEENVLLMVDDSHGVGGFGTTGRGTEEYTGSGPSDVLVGTLGKAFGVNGGYVAGDATLIAYLRETAPFYIYSNPITPAEASAAIAALDILESERGQQLLDHLRSMTRRFEQGLLRLGYETIPGEHPVVPLMVRDTPRTRDLVKHLRAAGVLATGLSFPVVPRGDEEIRFQVNADHTPGDIDQVLEVLAAWPGRQA